MLSLTPRYDQFRFHFPKEFLPKEVTEKWMTFMAKDSQVLTTPIDYLNESIKGITLPGISDLIVTQTQHSSNPVRRTINRMNTEPNQNNSTYVTNNPLDKIDRKVTVTFRMNQGLYNYFMLYETVFHRICKQHLYKDGDELVIDILGETGVVMARIYLHQCYIEGLEGLDFSYDKVERQSETFTMTLVFNNIDMEFVDEITAR